jgi:hypothetical protein
MPMCELRSLRAPDAEGTEPRQVDPVTDQTREVTAQLFAAELVSGAGCHVEPAAAFAAWRVHATRRRDAGLVRIMDRLDLDTFERTWRELVAVLRFRGVPGMLVWLETRQRGKL